MKDMSVPSPDDPQTREDFDPGSLVINNFVSDERLDEILGEVTGEELLNQEDQSLMSSAGIDFMTEEQELEMIMQLAAWADTFILTGPYRTSFRALGSAQASRNSEGDRSGQKPLARSATQ